MTPEERFRQIDALIDPALELEGQARTAFLDQECGGDAKLRDEIEKLLVSHEQAGSFLAAPAMEVIRQGARSRAGRTSGRAHARSVSDPGAARCGRDG